MFLLAMRGLRSFASIKVGECRGSKRAPFHVLGLFMPSDQPFYALILSSLSPTISALAHVHRSVG